MSLLYHCLEVTHYIPLFLLNLMVSHVTSGSLNISTFMAIDWRQRRLAYIDQIEKKARERLIANTFANTYCNTSYPRQKKAPSYLPVFVNERNGHGTVGRAAQQCHRSSHASKSRKASNIYFSQCYPSNTLRIFNLDVNTQRCFSSYPAILVNPTLRYKGRCRTLRVRCVVLVCNHNTDGTPTVQRTVTSARNSRIPPLLSRVGPREHENEGSLEEELKSAH
jgi:hypothetical protein